MWIRPDDVCVVTGGNNGLGAEIMKAFASKGIRTVSLDVSAPQVKSTESTQSFDAASDTDVDDSCHPEALDQLEQSEGSKNKEEIPTTTKSIAEPVKKSILQIRCDVRNTEDLQKARLEIYREFQCYPSIIVLNAAIRCPWSSVVDSEFEDFESTVNVNLGGLMKSVRVFLPDLVENNRGFVVTIGSALGIIVPKGQSAYAASKAGVLSFHESLSLELSEHKLIHAMLVCPGQLDTNMFADVETPSSFFAPVVCPAKLATKIVKRVTKGKACTVYAPLYVRYLPLMHVMPTPLAQLARRLSGIDNVYEQVKASASKESTENPTIPEDSDIEPANQKDFEEQSQLDSTEYEAKTVI